MINKLELYQQLADLREQAPDKWDEVVKAHPEWFQAIVDEQREVEILLRVKSDSPEGYFAFYEGIHGIIPPWQVATWIREIYKGHEQGLGYTVNGYRGSWKSVSISVDFVAWRIANEPQRTNLVLSANDDSADKITKAISQIIEFHPFWKKAFGHIVPDAGRWSTNGYWVVDSSMDKEEWAKRQAGVIDPTLIGGGYTSTKINGKHPTGVCLSDDLHGINNSTSETERKSVVTFFVTELSKTHVRKDDKLLTWPVNIGVPWGRDDVHQIATKSGGYLSSTLPVMRAVVEGEEGAIYIDGVNEITGAVYDDIKGWWVLANPENFGVSSIKRDRGLGKSNFWQMMMMDLNRGNVGGLRYYSYPHAEIDLLWPAIGGSDPSYTFKERKEINIKSSFFALGVGLKRPRGGGVLQGGILDQCSTNTAAGYISAMQSRFANWLYTAVEDNGIGRLFIETIRLINPSLIIVCSDLGGIRQKGEKAGRMKDKVLRFKTEAAPFLENATFFISDEQTDYLDTIRDGLDNFDELDSSKADKRLDALDSLYHILKAMPDVLQQRAVKDELPSIFSKQKSAHPLAGRNHK